MASGKWEDEDPKMKDFIKALNAAPTLKGLERIMRYCLLRYLKQTK
jgi:hypothetical protein